MAQDDNTVIPVDMSKDYIFTPDNSITDYGPKQPKSVLVNMFDQAAEAMGKALNPTQADKDAANKRNQANMKAAFVPAVPGNPYGDSGTSSTADVATALKFLMM